ncbi:hypothetical protein WG66_003024 [Moniliophthora roreri]|nr:hypothetical protein WG66_003024 [Moniliophthora roreri]
MGPCATLFLFTLLPHRFPQHRTLLSLRPQSPSPTPYALPTQICISQCLICTIASSRSESGTWKWVFPISSVCFVCDSISTQRLHHDTQKKYIRGSVETLSTGLGVKGLVLGAWPGHRVVGYWQQRTGMV